MRTITSEAQRFPNPKSFLPVLVVKNWVANRIIELISGPQTPANKKSLARFQAVDTDKMMMEPPTLYKDNKMLVCVLSRKAGTMWVDQVIEKLKWDHFLSTIDPNNKFSSLPTVTPGVATKADLLTLAQVLLTHSKRVTWLLTRKQNVWLNKKKEIVKGTWLTPGTFKNVT